MSLESRLATFERRLGGGRGPGPISVAPPPGPKYHRAGPLRPPRGHRPPIPCNLWPPIADLGVGGTPVATAPDTDELLRLSAAGDPDARGRLLDRHRGRLRQMVA